MRCVGVMVMAFVLQLYSAQDGLAQQVNRAAISHPASSAQTNTVPANVMKSHSAPRAWRLRPSDAYLHAGSSAAIQLMGYGGLRVLSVKRAPATVVSLTVTIAAGVGKELYDRKTGGDVSFRDLLWDVVGAGAGFALASLADR